MCNGKALCVCGITITTRSLLGNADDSASGTGSGVASLERLLVPSLAEVVGAGVDDDGALDQSQRRVF